MTALVSSPWRSVVVAMVLGLAATWMRLPATERYAEADAYEDVYYLPRAGWLTAMSLGYREALADLLWMRTLVYYGDELTHHGRERHMFEYAEAVLGLDPDFLGVYRRIGALVIYRSDGQASTEDVERVAALMERGAARFPNDGPLAWSTGATLAFELVPLYRGRPEEQDRVRERAAPYLVRAAELGAAPPYAVLTNSALLERVGHAEEAAAHLEEMYATTSDLDLRNEIAARIQTLRSGAFADAFVSENARFEDAWSRQMPYAPATLYDLVGPVPVVDTVSVLRDGFGVSALEPPPAIE